MACPLMLCLSPAKSSDNTALASCMPSLTWLAMESISCMYMWFVDWRSLDYTMHPRLSCSHALASHFSSNLRSNQRQAVVRTVNASVASNNTFNESGQWESSGSIWACWRHGMSTKQSECERMHVYFISGFVLWWFFVSSIQLYNFNQAFMDKLHIKPYIECLYSDVSGNINIWDAVYV